MKLDLSAYSNENAVIQFSGGRTSAYMLWLILQSFGGVLPATWKVCFENTGKEREETLEFIHEIEQRWSVPVVWLEFADAFDAQEYLKPDGTYRTRKLRFGVHYRITNFVQAQRAGQPFDAFVDMLASYRKTIKDEPPVLPNVAQRMCTDRMKVKVCHTYLRDCGWPDWVVFMGIRADEAHRRAKMLAWIPAYELLETPLIEAGVTKKDVMAFWATQPFDLKLDANSDEGNCDMCFLKATAKLVAIGRKYPERIAWWAALEKRTGQTFSRTKITYTQLQEMITTNDPRLSKWENNTADKTVDCFCGE